MNLDKDFGDKPGSGITYYLEYNPTTGFWHHNSGNAPLNTVGFFKISEKTDDTLFQAFQELMEKKYKLMDVSENPLHYNPAVVVIKKEWAYFLEVVDAVDKRRKLFV